MESDAYNACDGCAHLRLRERVDADSGRLDRQGNEPGRCSGIFAGRAGNQYFERAGCWKIPRQTVGIYLSFLHFGFYDTYGFIDQPGLFRAGLQH